MTFALASKFHVYLKWVNTFLAYCLVGTLNQENALKRRLLSDCGIYVNVH